MSEVGRSARVYLDGLRYLTGAVSVSLMVPLPGGNRAPLLIHSGDGAPVPELADEESARRFLNRAGAAEEATGGEPVWIESRLAEGSLAALAAPEPVRPFGQPERRRSDVRGVPAASSVAWLGFHAGRGRPRLLGPSAQGPAGVADAGAAWWEWMMSLGSHTARDIATRAAALGDPITGLPGRTGFRATLDERFESAGDLGEPITLLLVNPDDFGVVNERFGQAAGDRVVRAIGDRMRSALRAADPVFRYGGVVFAAMIDAGLDTARVVADKIMTHLTAEPYLEGAVRLSFSIGIASFDPAAESIEPLVLVRRATQALNLAKRSGGGAWVPWQESSEIEERDELDRLTGIFTGNATRDYRNMLLLRDVVDIVADGPDLETLAARVTERLFSTLRADRLALYLRGDDGQMALVHQLSRREPGGKAPSGDRTEERQAAMESIEGAVVRPAAVRRRVDGLEGCAVPLSGGGQGLGCLFLGYRDRTLALGASDLMLLESLCNQLGVALDRARLAEHERRRREEESRELRAEVTQLRSALEHSRLIYASEQMDAVVQMARRVARTEATVLVAGESGTGKELISRMLHELSPRADGPFVIVDCGAIATSLIESELFGHEKGAYTGAQGARVGRLAQAEGGTLLLDEIGELPLEVQTRLLRFVQDRQVVAVGGSQVRKVDVRILAATNRDLEEEVANGLFREDLFFRLNVMRLAIPALRERRSDVLPLARHFLKVFSVEYGKRVRDLSPEAEAAVVSYPWPGNVRELQNRMMRGVILCEDELLGLAELDLPDVGEVAVVPPVPRPTKVVRTEEVQQLSPSELWERLRQALARYLEPAATAEADWPLLPIGSCLREDLVLAAYEAANEVVRRAAALVGVAESTFRERLKKVRQRVVAGVSPRPPGWVEVQSLLGEIVERGGETDPFAQTEGVLLGEITKRFPDDAALGADLLGVTPATFRRRLAALGRG